MTQVNDWKTLIIFMIIGATIFITVSVINALLSAISAAFIGYLGVGIVYVRLDKNKHKILVLIIVTLVMMGLSAIGISTICTFIPNVGTCMGRPLISPLFIMFFTLAFLISQKFGEYNRKR